MKLGFVTSILDQYPLEQVIEVASGIGYECLEVACWPKGAAERRYAGVTHLDVEHLEERDEAKLHGLLKAKNITVSSLAYYPNTITSDLTQRAAHVSHLLKLIDCAQRLKVNMVTSFVGRVQEKTVAENLKIRQSAGKNSGGKPQDFRGSMETYYRARRGKRGKSRH